jgi:hypothetical protein
MAYSVWELAVAIGVTAMVAFIMSPLVIQYGGANTSNQVSGLFNTSNTMFTQNIYNPIAQTAISNNGFGTSLFTTSLTAVAFIYNGFYSFVQTIMLIGTMFNFILTTLINMIGLATYMAVPLQSIVSLAVTLISFRLILVFIGMWMKTDVVHM